MASYASVNTGAFQNGQTAGQLVAASAKKTGKPAAWQPSNPSATTNTPQTWTNTATGQQVFGQIAPSDPFGQDWSSVVAIGPQGQPTGQIVTPSGQSSTNSLGRTLAEGAGLAAIAPIAGIIAGPTAAATTAATSTGVDPFAAAFSAANAPAGTDAATAAFGAGQGVNAAEAGTAAATTATGSSLLSNPFVNALIQDGLKLGGTAIESNAISNAVKTQAAGTSAALASNASIYNNNRAALQPYIATGTGASNLLASLYGLPTSPVPTNVPVGASATGLSQGLVPSTTPGFGTPGTTISAPAGSTLSAPLSPPNTPTAANTSLSALSPTGAVTSTNTTMRAPDGSIESVPTAQVAHYQALGAQVVGA